MTSLSLSKKINIKCRIHININSFCKWYSQPKKEKIVHSPFSGVFTKLSWYISLFFYKRHHNTRFLLTGTLSFLQSSNKYLSMSSSKYIWIYEAVLHYVRNKYHVPCITSVFSIHILFRSSFLWGSWFTFQSIISKFRLLKYFQRMGSLFLSLCACFIYFPILRN